MDVNRNTAVIDNIDTLLKLKHSFPLILTCRIAITLFCSPGSTTATSYLKHCCMLCVYVFVMV